MTGPTIWSLVSGHAPNLRLSPPRLSAPFVMYDGLLGALHLASCTAVAHIVGGRGSQCRSESPSLQLVHLVRFIRMPSRVGRSR